MSLVIGIDGGGTSTQVALAEEGGKVLGIGSAGPGNYHDVGPEAVRMNVATALAAAWQQAGRPREEAATAFLGMAGVGSQADRDITLQIARDLQLAPADRVEVDHDLRVALAGGLAGKPGIVLVVGTGSSCYGRADDGRTWKSGGWGSTLDDVGSANDLGTQAIVAAVRDEDGRGDATVLKQRVLAALATNDLRRIMARVDARDLSRSEIGRLAHLVTAAAVEGDAAARAIIARGTEQLALMVAAVSRKLGFDGETELHVVVTGGLGQSAPVYKDPLYAAIRTKVPNATLVEPVLPPAVGAALLALGMLGHDSQTELAESLAASMAS